VKVIGFNSSEPYKKDEQDLAGKLNIWQTDDIKQQVTKISLAAIVFDPRHVPYL